MQRYEVGQKVQGSHIYNKFSCKDQKDNSHCKMHDIACPCASELLSKYPNGTKFLVASQSYKDDSNIYILSDDLTITEMV